jgi:hypothetical protein
LCRGHVLGWAPAGARYIGIILPGIAADIRRHDQRPRGQEPVIEKIHLIGVADHLVHGAVAVIDVQLVADPTGALAAVIDGRGNDIAIRDIEKGGGKGDGGDGVVATAAGSRDQVAIVVANVGAVDEKIHAVIDDKGKGGTGGDFGGPEAIHRQEC